MLPTEYERMAAVEDEHWWYRGTRDLLDRLLQRQRHRIARNARVVDAGCGTGANLQWLADTLQPSSLVGFDVSEQAVEHAQRKAPAARVCVGDLCCPPADLGPIDILLCVDVLYMTGLDAARSGLHQLVQQLSSGGWLVLHVPAYNWLYSRHDVAVGTRQRFTSREIRQLLHDLGLSIELLTYRMCLLFPLVMLSRLPSLLVRQRRPQGAIVQSDLFQPAAWLNTFLLGTVQMENRLLERGLRFPWGSSIVALGRKP